MKVFVLNAGSSSLKYQIIDVEEQKIICKGMVDRIGNGTKLIYKYGFDTEEPKTITQDIDANNHEESLKRVIEKIIDSEIGVLNSVDEIDAIGHRVVHGGEFFKDSTLINEEVISSIKKCIPLGPLHNPANLSGIMACEDLFPNKKQVAVFDTAFHQSMPKEAYFYGIDKNFYDKYSIRRYGFHGTSYKFISEELAKTNSELKKIIVCHLGNGASMCAIKDGKSIDTTMGFTPLEGLMMGTRSGDLDPAIVTFLCENENLSPKEVDTLLNKKSGLGSFSQISSDMRDIWEKENEGVEHAKTTIDLFSYKIKKYVGAYAAALGGLDAVIFTGGIGENAYYVRSRALKDLDFLGINIDEEKNKNNDILINSSESKVKVFVMPTNEELMIAKETKRLANAN